MKRSSFVTVFVFVAGLGIGYFARGAMGMLQQRDRHTADLARIEQLHQKDIEATRLQDPKGLLEIWTEDAVRLNPGNPPAVGRPAIQAENQKFHLQYPEFKVLSYTAAYGKTQIEDGWACEWGEHKGRLQLSPDTQPASMDFKALHVLRREGDGTWRFVMIFPEQ